jgi:SAM-dependent methyltransferase
MATTMPFDLDETGKIDLSAIYDRPDPRRYYQTLFKLDYQIPALAEANFRAVINARRRSRQRRQLSLLDVGCSYGVNAAILNHKVSLPDLFRLYGQKPSGDLSRSELVVRDRKLFSEARPDREIKVVGLDVAGEALDYAAEIGIIDARLATNLELVAPKVEDKELLAESDVVISTGAIGYVGEATFSRILDCAERSPWFALFALRMFPISEITTMLRSNGYVVYRQRGRTYRQRRFAGPDEKQEVLARLAALNIDPTGLEADGWYHAEFYFACRQGEGTPPPLDGLSPL